MWVLQQKQQQQLLLRSSPPAAAAAAATRGCCWRQQQQQLLSAARHRRRRVASPRPPAAAGGGSGGGGGGGGDGYNYSDGVNAFLGRFLPSTAAARDELQRGGDVDFDAPKASGITLEELAARLEQKLAETEWFVTGRVDASLFSEDFAFKDETVSTRGVRAYAAGVRKLFDQRTARAELVEVYTRPSTHEVVVVWRLEGRVNLPLKPAIKPYVVTTTFGVDPASGLIASQVDEFGVPGWDLLLSAFLGHGVGAPPAPPVERLRAEAAERRRQSGGG